MRWLAVSVVILMAFAGCGGKDGGNKVRLGDGTKIGLDVEPEQEPKDEYHGTISGIVVDDAIYPLPGAQVFVKGRPLNQTADEDGRFVIEDVVGGIHILEVHKPGYAVAASTVNVRGGDVAKVIIISARVPIPEPYCSSQQYDTYSLSATQMTTGEGNHRFLAAIDNQPVADVIVESIWDESGFPVSPESALAYTITPQSDTAREVGGSGPNPLYLSFDRDFLPSNEYAVAVEIHPEPIYTEVTGKIYVSVFYLDRAPSGWSFLEGDTC